MNKYRLFYSDYINPYSYQRVVFFYYDRTNYSKLKKSCTNKCFGRLFIHVFLDFSFKHYYICQFKS
jgi:hypothetical protein